MFVKRLFLYLIGFFIGSLIVYFLFFKGQNRSFLPGSIVLDTITSKTFVLEPKAECMLKCYDVSQRNIKQLLRDGDVIFSESSPRQTPKKYVVEIETDEEIEL